MLLWKEAQCVGPSTPALPLWVFASRWRLIRSSAPQKDWMHQFDKHSSTLPAHTRINNNNNYNAPAVTSCPLSVWQCWNSPFSQAAAEKSLGGTREASKMHSQPCGVCVCVCMCRTCASLMTTEVNEDVYCVALRSHVCFFLRKGSVGSRAAPCSGRNNTFPTCMSLIYAFIDLFIGEGWVVRWRMHIRRRSMNANLLCCPKADFK